MTPGLFGSPPAEENDSPLNNTWYSDNIFRLKTVNYWPTNYNFISG